MKDYMKIIIALENFIKFLLYNLLRSTFIPGKGNIYWTSNLKFFLQNHMKQAPEEIMTIFF